MIKKNLGKYLLVAVGIIGSLAFRTTSVQAASLNMHYSDYWYNRAKADGSAHHSWHYTLYELDGKLLIVLSQIHQKEYNTIKALGNKQDFQKI